MFQHLNLRLGPTNAQAIEDLVAFGKDGRTKWGEKGGADAWMRGCVDAQPYVPLIWTSAHLHQLQR